MNKPNIEWTVEQLFGTKWRQHEYPVKFKTMNAACKCLNEQFVEGPILSKGHFRVVRNDTKRRGKFIHHDPSDHLDTRSQLEAVITSWEAVLGSPGSIQIPTSYKQSIIVNFHEDEPYPVVRITLHDLRGTYGDKLWRIQFGKSLRDIEDRETSNV